MEKNLREKLDKIIELENLYRGVKEQIRFMNLPDNHGNGIITSPNVAKGCPTAIQNLKKTGNELFENELVRIEKELEELVK